MRKFLPLILSLLLLTVAACAEESPFFWERDGVTHWQLDASGAIINQGEHTISNENLRCTVCGCEILDWGDGSIDVTDYDEYGNLLRYTSFADGEKTYESIHVLTYGEDGVVLSDKEYLNGTLYGETIYTISAEGEQLPVTVTVWNDDGTTSVNEYDEHGNCICSVIYAEDGAVIHETLSEFALDDNGWYYECKTTSRFDSGETFYTETNQHDDQIRVLNTHADGTAWADEVYEYKYKGSDKVWCKHYSFGKLIMESMYNNEGSCIQETEYLEDGSKIISLYSEQGDITSATSYAADGSVVTTTTYEYVHDDDQNQREIRVFIDGVLAKETIFHYDEEVSFTGSTETTYHADGARTVHEFGNWLELISTTEYAADGSVISVTTADEVY